VTMIFQVNPRFAKEALRELQAQGVITCTRERDFRNGKFTVMSGRDVETTKEILREKSIEYSVAKGGNYETLG